VQRSAWLGSLSDNRKPKRHQLSLLDVSMIVSVIIALTAMAVWFFAFAHTTGPLPD
jgi:cytoskeletal protein RodZ